MMVCCMRPACGCPPATPLKVVNRTVFVFTDILRRDPQYLKYTAAIERVLSSFDGVSEWPDITAFLLRFQKVRARRMTGIAGVLTNEAQALSAGAAYPVIPFKVIAAKRLAQCLNPALPAGVHLKALEVYTQIFERIGVRAARRVLLS